MRTLFLFFLMQFSQLREKYQSSQIIIEYVFCLLLTRILSTNGQEIHIDLLVQIEDSIFAYFDAKKKKKKSTKSTPKKGFAESSKRTIEFKNRKEIVSSYSFLIGILSKNRSVQ